MTGDLVTWLRAQLDEDERIAQELGGEGWHAHPADAHGMRRVMVDYSIETVVACTLAPRGAHIARHDPARVLAEVDAKRRILDEHHPIDPCDAHDAALRSVPCPTLRLVALPYADRTGYREEWAP